MNCVGARNYIAECGNPHLLLWVGRREEKEFPFGGLQKKIKSEVFRNAAVEVICCGGYANAFDGSKW